MINSLFVITSLYLKFLANIGINQLVNVVLELRLSCPYLLDGCERGPAFCSFGKMWQERLLNLLSTRHDCQLTGI